MSRELTKQELVRLSWLTELRRQGDRQCEGIGNGKTVCALALLHEVAVGRFAPYPFPYDAVASAAGLTGQQAWLVAMMNDGCPFPSIRQHTFSEIADVVEGWFRKDAA